MVRRIAATREELGDPGARAPQRVVRRARASAAIDRDDDDAFGGLIGEYRTLLRVRERASTWARRCAACLGERRAFRPTKTTIAIDALLLVDDGAFGWRRLAALGEFALEPVELGPIVAAGRSTSSPSRPVCVSAFRRVGERCRRARRVALEARADRARRRAHAAGDRRRGRRRPRRDRGRREPAADASSRTRCARSRAPTAFPTPASTDVLAPRRRDPGARTARPCAALERIARDFDARAHPRAGVGGSATSIDEFEAELAGVHAAAARASRPSRRRRSHAKRRCR